MAVHVRADDVHLLRMRRANLGAEHFLPLARRIPLGVDPAERGVGLPHRIGVHAGPGARALHDVGVVVVADAVDGAATRKVRIRSAGATTASATAFAGRAAPTARWTTESGDAVDAIRRVVAKLASGVRVDHALGL